MDLLISYTIISYSEKGALPDPILESANTNHIRTLANFGVDVGLDLADGETLLHRAARTGNLEVFYLIQFIILFIFRTLGGLSNSQFTILKQYCTIMPKSASIKNGTFTLYVVRGPFFEIAFFLLVHNH